MIKEINEENFKQFYKLMAEVECGESFCFENKNHLKWLDHKIHKHFSRGARCFAYYTDDNLPVGFIIINIEEGPEGVKYIKKKCELLDIGVFEEFRGQGIGSKFLTYIEEYLKKIGVYCIYMSTWVKDYKVICFYGKNGYIPVASIPDFNGPNDEGIVIMRKIL